MNIFKKNLIGMVAPIMLAFLIGCNLPISGRTTTLEERATEMIEVPSATNELPQVDPTATLQPPRTISICTESEPASLFLYGDNSLSARAIRQALYDGPFDVVRYEFIPVLLEETPTLANGSVFFEQVEANPGDLITASNGLRANLGEGVAFFPAGCTLPDCSVFYSGTEPVMLDQMVVRFRLRQGVQWSDGASLTADDSLYSYEVAKSLFPRARAELLSNTQTYKVLDDYTVEWRGLPGFRYSHPASFFFTPLPRHAWNGIANQDLPSSETPTRQPLSYGAYQIEDWRGGEWVSLRPNPNYFRAEEGLPYFDELVFRFVTDGGRALEMLLSGECDLLDESYNLNWLSAELMELVESQELELVRREGTSWEQITFGVLPASGDTSPLPSLLHQKELRQALAGCIDRQRIVNELFNGQTVVLDSYVPPFHPLFNPDIPRYSYDPQNAGMALQNLGWLDLDGDPTTPRVSQGVSGVTDGIPLSLSYLVAEEDISMKTAEIVRASLANCGVELQIQPLEQNALLAPGPEGLIFGRQFQLAQFSWVSSLEPACFLYFSAEIPGPYPEFPKGWGGANAAGYSSPELDRRCLQAMISPAEDPGYFDFHASAQKLIAEDLPVMPLYLHNQILVVRPDFCGLDLDPSVRDSFWNLERFNFGSNCE
jgi:peptide/nickel transport system substrate-binding protein